MEIKRNDNKKVFLIEKFFNANECKILINYLEFLSFSDIHTNKLNEKFKDNTFRTDQGCIINSDILANKIQDNLKSYKILDGILDKNFKINPIIRASKYTKGQQTIVHTDGKIPGKIVKYTVLIYLNTINKSDGGETKLYENEESFNINPKIGSILIFDNNIKHSGAPLLVDDIKYCLRTDIISDINVRRSTTGKGSRVFD
jgi:hypothetical protein